MSEALWLLLASALSVTGMGWIALSMEVHWGQVMHRHAEDAKGIRRSLRWVGAASLLLVLVICLLADRPSMAVLVWVMLLAGSAMVIGMALSWRPRWIGRLAKVTTFL